MVVECAIYVEIHSKRPTLSGRMNIGTLLSIRDVFCISVQPNLRVLVAFSMQEGKTVQIGRGVFSSTGVHNNLDCQIEVRRT